LVHDIEGGRVELDVLFPEDGFRAAHATIVLVALLLFTPPHSILSFACSLAMFTDVGGAARIGEFCIRRDEGNLTNVAFSAIVSAQLFVFLQFVSQKP